jgi:hypothetical protein
MRDVGSETASSDKTVAEPAGPSWHGERASDVLARLKATAGGLAAVEGHSVVSGTVETYCLRPSARQPFSD